MARGSSGIPSENWITQITDRCGNVICRIGHVQYTVTDNQGRSSMFHESDNITLSDNSVWNPSMMKAPGIFIGVCESCRNPKFSIWRQERATHGLTTLHTATRCANCNSLCCPSHSILCSDGLYRCPDCIKKYNGISWLKRLFFNFEE
jgi:hypothetical protein